MPGRLFILHQSSQVMARHFFSWHHLEMEISGTLNILLWSKIHKATWYILSRMEIIKSKKFWRGASNPDKCMILSRNRGLKFDKYQVLFLNCSYFRAIPQSNPSERHIFSISDEWKSGSRQPKCLTCDLPKELFRNCKYNKAIFSPRQVLKF